MTFIARILLWAALFPFLLLVIITQGDEVAEEVHDGFGALIDTLLDK